MHDTLCALAFLSLIVVPCLVTMRVAENHKS